MKKFLVKTVAASGFIAALAVAGSAQQTPTQTAPPEGQGKHMGHRGGERGMHRMFEGLNLSDAQKQQIGAIMSKHQADTQAQREEAHTLMKQKRQGATLTAEQQARLQTLHTQLREGEKQTHQEIIAILTPEQQAQLKAKMQEMHARKKTGGAFGDKQPNQ